MKKKVLVLEDEDNIRAFVVINLKRAGYETVEFALGEEAAEHLRDHRDVAIAILDVMLPGMNGFSLCETIRRTDQKIGIIILMFCLGLEFNLHKLVSVGGTAQLIAYAIPLLTALCFRLLGQQTAAQKQ